MIGKHPLAALAALVAFSPCLATARVHESTNKDAIPFGWARAGQAVPSTELHLAIALKQPGLQDLRVRLDAASDPNHQDFGRHVSQHELSRWQEPEAEGVSLVSQWLKDAGITYFSQNGAWITMNVTVAQANALLNCQLQPYTRPGHSSNHQYRALEYSLPSNIVRYVDFVFPVTQFLSWPERNSVPQAEEARKTARSIPDTVPPSCFGLGVTPDCLADFFNITYIPPDNMSGSALGIAGFLEQYPDNKYLHEFLQTYSPRRNTTGYMADSYNFTVESIQDGKTDPGRGVEAMLDTDYSMVFTQPLPVTFYSTGGRGPGIDEKGNSVDGLENEPWVPFLEALLAKNATTLPQVLSISYTDDEQSIPTAYAQRACDLFMQLTALGVSIIIASGDGGAAGVRRSNQCLSNDGNNTRKFLPSFPVSCPYVTGVGATMAYIPFEPSSQSSGGFSDVFERPAWQDDAVGGYLKRVGESKTPHAGLYNTSGRGIPDVSLIGSRLILRADAYEWTQSGTSASTPVFAAMIVLVNDARLRMGKSVLGFLNPILYSAQVAAAGVFLDVTSGFSASCVWSDGTVESGWEAVEGWDASTGLGVPDFGKLMDVLAGV